MIWFTMKYVCNKKWLRFYQWSRDRNNVHTTYTVACALCNERWQNSALRVFPNFLVNMSLRESPRIAIQTASMHPQCSRWFASRAFSASSFNKLARYDRDFILVTHADVTSIIIARVRGTFAGENSFARERIFFLSDRASECTRC